MLVPRLAAVFVIVIVACGGDDGDDAPAGERTLATCTTTAGADVPAFYRRYFRCVTIAKTAAGVTITSEDLPPHRSSYYGSASANYAAFDTTRGGQYHANPNLLDAQALTIAVPDAPIASGVVITQDLVDEEANTSSAEYALGPVGVAIDSVALFTGTAAPGMDIAEERFTFDSYEGHPQNTGVYHYHGPTPGPREVMATIPGEGAIELYGVMCDGTVVLGCAELDGAVPAGLDAQGGHVGDLRAVDGTLFFTARYHTHVCGHDGFGHLYTPEIHYYAACAR